MKRAEDKIRTAAGELVLALVGTGLAYLLFGRVGGLLVIGVIYAACQLGTGIREKRRTREEMRPAAEAFARALGGLRQQKVSEAAVEQVRQ